MPNEKAFGEKSVDDWEASSQVPLIASGSKGPEYTLDIVIHYHHVDPNYNDGDTENRLKFHIRDHRKFKERVKSTKRSIFEGEPSGKSILRQLTDSKEDTFKLHHQFDVLRDDLVKATGTMVDEIISEFKGKTSSSLSKGSIEFCEPDQSNCKLRWPRNIPHDDPPSSINDDSG